ncbi:MAG: hypothetical protein RL441_1443 [Actinomycetota bacterium]
MSNDNFDPNAAAPEGQPLETAASVAAEGTAAPKTKRTRWIIGGVVAAVVIAAGAGYAFVSNSPALKVVRALTNTASTSNIEVSIHVTPELLLDSGMTDAQVAEAGLPGIKTVADVAAALDLLAFQAAGESASDGSSNSRIAVTFDSKNVLYASIIDRTLYLQSDLTALTQHQYAFVTQSNIDEALAMFEGAPQEYLDAVAALKSGRPLSLSLAEGTALGDWYDQSGLAGSAGTTTAASDELTKAILDALTQSTSVTENGSDADGTIYDVVIDAGKFTSQLAPEIKKLAPDLSVLGVPTGTSIDELKNAAAGNSINVRVWLDGDVATKLAVDLTSAGSSKLEAWSAQVIVRFTPRDMTAPADSLDITSLVLPLLGA